MRHVAAYLLLVLGGKAAPTAEDVKGVLDAAGVAADDNQLSQLITALEGKDLDALITEGRKKLVNVGGGGGGAAPSAGGAAPAAGGAKAAEAKKEESSSEESVGAGGGGLFGEDEDW